MLENILEDISSQGARVHAALKENPSAFGKQFMCCYGGLNMLCTTLQQRPWNLEGKSRFYKRAIQDNIRQTRAMSDQPGYDAVKEFYDALPTYLAQLDTLKESILIEHSALAKLPGMKTLLHSPWYGTVKYVSGFAVAAAFHYVLHRMLTKRNN